jgi:hypothetical protein
MDPVDYSPRIRRAWPPKMEGQKVTRKRNRKGESKSPPVLHVTMENGAELQVPVDPSGLISQEFGKCQLTEFLGGPTQAEISITVRITYNEIGVWLAEQTRRLLRLPENIEISHEIDSRGDFSCRVHPSSGPVTEVFFNLYGTLSEDVHSLVRYVGGWGRLLDAGFEILDSSCITFNNEEGYVDLMLTGLVGKLSID